MDISNPAFPIPGKGTTTVTQFVPKRNWSRPPRKSPGSETPLVARPTALLPTLLAHPDKLNLVGEI
jgi:hypothetical protein